MYIKTEYKDAYLRYLQSMDYSANTVRNLRSDLSTLLIWMGTRNFQITVDSLYDEYQQYLIVSRTPHHTMNRRLSSLSKFVQWVHSEHPSLSETPQGQPHTAHLDALKYEQGTSGKAGSRFKILTPLLVIVAVTSLLMSSIFVFRIMYPPLSADKTALPVISSSNSEYTLQFDLAFSSPIGLLNKSKSHLTFTFYLQKDQIHSIGYVDCPFKDTYFKGGFSRLKVRLDNNCSPLPPLVHDAIARNEAISTDIYVNDKKLTFTKVSLNNQNIVNDDLNYQGEMIDTLSKDSKVYDLLPNGILEGNVLGLETASQSATLKDSIPLSVFRSVTPLDDGDIVTIYNNDIIRALLSTKIFGIKSSDHIITQGIAYVHVVNSPGSSIIEGDYISTSTIPGYGQKATNKYDSIVGVALEPYIPGNSYLKVLLTFH